MDKGPGTKWNSAGRPSDEQCLVTAWWLGQVAFCRLFQLEISGNEEGNC